MNNAKEKMASTYMSKSQWDAIETSDDVKVPVVGKDGNTTMEASESLIKAYHGG
jgi:hypothetical protein